MSVPPVAGPPLGGPVLPEELPEPGEPPQQEDSPGQGEPPELEEPPGQGEPPQQHDSAGQGEPPDMDEPPDMEEPSEAELLGLWPDPFAGSPDGADAWLADLSLPELDALADDWERNHRPTRQDAVGAGFARDLPADPATGFAAGGPLDSLAPGPVLAGFAAETFDAGFGSLRDDELVGVLCAARRLESWQAAMEFTAVAELDRRRRAAAERPESSRVHDHVNAEVAAALVLTGRSADALLDLSRSLARLPLVLAALAAGRIDRERAAVFAAELAVLDERSAAAIAMAFTGIAGQMTTGQLRFALRAMVLALNPEAARQRAEKGRHHARVELWPESSGNSGLAGRELPPAEVIAADARIAAIAQALRDAGVPGDMDHLRAAVFTALLSGRDLASLFPADSHRASGGGPDAGDVGTSDGDSGAGHAAEAAERVAAMTGSVHLTMPASAWLGWSDAPGEVAGFGPVDADTCRGLAERLAADPANRWCLTLADPHGRAVAHGCARAGPGAASPASEPNATAPPPARPPPARLPAKPPPTGPPPTGPPPTGPPTYSPFQPDRPRSPGSRRDGEWHAWLASMKLHWLERGRCGHERRTSSYRPQPTLRHLIDVRHRTCGFPGCTRPVRCDADHTVPFDRGGITCECNLATLCRQHHKTKQAQGWVLTQPEPGVLIWTTPSGRSYTTEPGGYPV